MTLLNILKTAKEIHSTMIAFNEDEDGTALFTSINYILEAAISDEVPIIDKKVALLILSVFKLQHESLIKNEMNKDVLKRLITDPEDKLIALVG